MFTKIFIKVNKNIENIENTFKNFQEKQLTSRFFTKKNQTIFQKANHGKISDFFAGFIFSGNK
ncbi:hypothetical protein LJC08_02885 [Methanimicrococcus sp. OttesenSCG-928-J09]|nr:hypothetical protein [Methanimicrococcus sp. OttesenSCG-928-J09]